MKPSLAEKVFAKANELFEASGMTLEELGLKMGYAPGMARKSAWAFLKNTTDPRLSTMESLAAALGVEVIDLFATSSKGDQSMTAYTAEMAERGKMIDDIMIACENHNFELKGRRLAQVRKLPISYLQRLKEALDQRDPSSTKHIDDPSSIVQRFISEYQPS